MSTRKPISQREAMRMRKRLRELKDSLMDERNQIFNGDFQMWGALRGVIHAAALCEHLVVCKCEGNAVTFHILKP